MRKFAVLACAALLLAGCETGRSYRGERPPMYPAVRRAMPMPQHSAPPVQESAPVRIASSGTGKLASAEAGNYMDQQERELRQRLRTRGVSVRRQGDNILLTIGNDILFDTGSADLSPRAGQIVAAMADVLMRYNKTFVQVGGYSDTAGSPDQNLKLSQARAEAMADRLTDRGVDRARVSEQGYGETHLKIPTGDHVNEPRNRRVEIRIVPHTEG
jgi:outer membrane protein OmpA-like peptidoglycan-associated protein